mmetsp:Transcript_24569/g.36057  ORF Transcript_24569/g.36057 Transcript_24569/m.36057 type:complete len:211 (+) Transcript_24569:44-676(+)
MTAAEELRVPRVWLRGHSFIAGNSAESAVHWSRSSLQNVNDLSLRQSRQWLVVYCYKQIADHDALRTLSLAFVAGCVLIELEHFQVFPIPAESHSERSFFECYCNFFDLFSGFLEMASHVVIGVSIRILFFFLVTVFLLKTTASRRRGLCCWLLGRSSGSTRACSVRGWRRGVGTAECISGPTNGLRIFSDIERFIRKPEVRLRELQLDE